RRVERYRRRPAAGVLVGHHREVGALRVVQAIAGCGAEGRCVGVAQAVGAAEVAAQLDGNGSPAGVVDRIARVGCAGADEGDRLDELQAHEQPQGRGDIVRPDTAVFGEGAAAVDTGVAGVAGAGRIVDDARIVAVAGRGV